MRITLAVCLAALALPAPARATCTVESRDSLRCPDWFVEMEVPAEWELSVQSSYPGIVASGVHRQGTGRLTLAAEKLASLATTSKAYAEKNRDALKKVGFKTSELSPHPSGAVLLDASTSDGTRRVRQGYLVKDGVAYVLTLAAPARSLRGYFRAFDDTLRSLRFTARPASEGEPAPAPAEEPATPAEEPGTIPPERSWVPGGS